MRYFITFISIVFVACSPPAETGSDGADRLSDLNCPPIRNVDAALGNEARDIVIVGELHGNVETPAFADALVCESLSRGYGTVLALELDDSSGRLSDYLATDGGEAAKAALFEDGLWTNGFTDGRSSVAMLALMDAAGRYKRDGHDLDIVFFRDPPSIDDPNPTPSEYSDLLERHMADIVLQAAEGRDRTIVLVGNVHARKTEVAFGDRRYTAMAGHMPEGRILSLLAASEGGTSWNCVGTAEGETACGAHARGRTLGPDTTLSYSGVPEIVLSSETDALTSNDRHDGVVLIGTMRASEPANLENREPFPALP